MAISGFYKSGEHGDLGAYVKAYVRLPRLGVQELLDFLVDSGSDRTILHAGPRRGAGEAGPPDPHARAR